MKRLLLLAALTLAAGAAGWYGAGMADHERRLRKDAAIVAELCQPDNEVEAESDECAEHEALGVR